MTIEDIKGQYAGRKPEPIGRHRFFSVLIPFVETEEGISLCFEVRAKTMESQPGEICFPGGHVEKGEDPQTAAIRETYEEIGIPKESIELIGPGDTLYGYANYTLYTYLGIISYNSFQNAILAKEEVDEIFYVPLAKFRDHPPEIYRENIITKIEEDFPYEKIGIQKDYPWRVGSWEIPVFDVDGRIIWGLTARITENLIRQLYPKSR